MANLSKEEMARREGMSYALRVAKTRGIKGLEEELESRQATNLPLRITKSDLKRIEEKADEYLQNEVRKIRNDAMECVVALAAMTLRDEFDFGQVRLERFAKRFWKKAECIDENYVGWKDILDTLEKECGMVFEITALKEKA